MSKPRYSKIPPSEAAYRIDVSSLEFDDDVWDEVTTVDVDVAFRLDIKRFPSSTGNFGNQLLLTVAKISERAKAAQIEIRHLADLGVMMFTVEDPDLEDDVVCRTENRQDYWTRTDDLRRVWCCLMREIANYRDIWLDKPHVMTRRPLRIAVGGMKYFNSFTSPGLLRVAPVYLSEETESRTGDPKDRPELPNLFL